MDPKVDRWEDRKVGQKAGRWEDRRVGPKADPKVDRWEDRKVGPREGRWEDGEVGSRAVKRGAWGVQRPVEKEPVRPRVLLASKRRA